MQLFQDHFWRNFTILMVGITLAMIWLAIQSNEIRSEQRASFESFRDNASCTELQAYLIENVDYITSNFKVDNESYMEIDQLYKVKCK